MRRAALAVTVVLGLSGLAAPSFGGTLSGKFALLPKGGPRVIRAAVKLKHPLAPAVERALAAAGARVVELPSGGLAAIGTVVSVDVPRDKLARLAALDAVERVEPARPLLMLRPLDQTARAIRAPEVWSPPMDRAGSDGSGTLIADHEGAWDVFHPDFFFPDGGMFEVQDARRDGRAGAGDRVDLDRDGRAESVLALLEGSRRDLYTGESGHADPGYQPDVDWLYVDANGNGRRDYGAGFSEDTPALGEPIFVGDDVNRDGVISGGERLVRLGRSKVRAVWSNGIVFARGQDLTRYAPADDTSHGTGAIGIVAGGWPELRRYTGVAPGAELLLIRADDDPVAGLAYALQRGVNVNFFEWDSPIEFADGSSPFEQAVTEAAERSAVQVAAAGNLAGADHVVRLGPLASGATAPLRLTTDGQGMFSFSAFWVTLTWIGEVTDLAAEIRVPGEQPLPFSGAQGQGDRGDFSFEWLLDRSPRGTAQLIFVATAPRLGVLPPAELTLTVVASSTLSEVRGIVFDDQSGWSRGVAWLDSLSDTGSALMPSTADRVIAVGAYGGNHDLTAFGLGAPGERRPYSGVGPRIDGAPLIDLLAPDDPFSAASDTIGPHGGYDAFGGTSGALPHVAGAAALLLGAGVGRNHDLVESLLTLNASADRFTGAVPNPLAGHGKLHVSRAVFGRERPGGTEPVLTLALEDEPVIVGQLNRVIARVGGGAAPIRIRWDSDYDRAYEREAPLGEDPSIVPTEVAQPIVAQAVDREGRTSRAILVVQGTKPCIPEQCGGGCCSPDGRCIPCGGADAGIDLDAGSPRTDSGAKSGRSLGLDEVAPVGCGCRATGRSRGAGLGALAALALGAALATSRGRRRRRWCDR